MRTLHVKPINQQELRKNWNFPMPNHYLNKSLFVKCNSKGVINWDYTSIHTLQDLESRGDYKIHYEKKYLVTIIFVEEGEHISLNPKEDGLDEYIQFHLGGWDNLNVASTSSDKLNKGNYQQAGTTKDGKKLFSILCF